MRVRPKARHIIRELFLAFLDGIRLPPPQFQEKAELDKLRAIADYIAGMTDRYAIREYLRLFIVENRHNSAIKRGILRCPFVLLAPFLTFIF